MRYDSVTSTVPIDPQRQIWDCSEMMASTMSDHDDVIAQMRRRISRCASAIILLVFLLRSTSIGPGSSVLLWPCLDTKSSDPVAWFESIACCYVWEIAAVAAVLTTTWISTLIIFLTESLMHLNVARNGEKLLSLTHFEQFKR